MLRKERIDAMQAYISEVKTASMKELEDKFSIAPSTLRRDLATLISNVTLSPFFSPDVEVSFPLTLTEIVISLA